MRKYLFISLSLITLFLCGCSKPDSFEVHGTVAGKRTMNLRIAYPGEDNLNNVLTAARDGEFDFKGNSPTGTLVEVLDNDYRPLARFYAVNGDKVKLFFDPDKPSATTAEGNEVDKALTDWVKANAKLIDSNSPRALNDAVAKYVKAHRNDVLSTILMASWFDASLEPDRAAKLLKMIAPEARPASIIGLYRLDQATDAKSLKVAPFTYVDSRDSLTHFRPKAARRSLIAMSSMHSGRGDSIVEALRKLDKRRPKNTAMVDLWLDTDTLMWHRTLRTDTVTWRAGWMPASVASPAISRLRVPALPYFIVTDSTGRQIYRGSSITVAADSLCR